MRCLILLACVGCGSVEGDKKMDAAINRDSPGPDSSMIDAPPPPCDLAKPFGALTPIPGVNTAGDERFGYLSSDELTIYLSDVDANRDIFSATRTSPTATFATPTVISGNVNTTSNEEHPSVTADGLMLVYESATFGTTVDIAYVTRSSTSASWGTIQELPGVNTTNFHELDATISADGLTVLFGSNRGGDYEIYRATRGSTSTAFGSAMQLAELGSSAVDSNPVLSADGLEIFFTSDRNGNSDVFHATRAQPSGTFGAPVPVTELNSTGVDINGWLSPDRCRILVTSSALGSYDLYIATRPK